MRLAELVGDDRGLQRVGRLLAAAVAFGHMPIQVAARGRLDAEGGGVDGEFADFLAALVQFHHPVRRLFRDANQLLVANLVICSRSFGAHQKFN